LDKPTNLQKFDLSATLVCISALCFWSLGPNFIKYLTGHLDSWTQNMLRYSTACLFWMPFLLFSIKRKRFDARIWRKAILPACVNLVFQSLWAAVFYYLKPAFLTLMMKTSVIWIAGFSLVFFAEERPLLRSRRFWLGLALSGVGVVGVLCWKADITESRTAIGIILGLLTALMWAVYVISVRVAFRDVDSRSGFSVISIYTAVGLCALAFLFGRPGQCLEMSAWPWACVVISGVLSIAVAHTLYYAAMRRIGATIPALVLLAQPFTVLAISHVLFEESLNGFQLLFGVVLLAGSALAIWAQKHLRRDSLLLKRK